MSARRNSRALPRPRPVVLTVAVLGLLGALLLPGMANARPTLPALPVVPTAATALAVVDALPPTPNTAWGIDPATDQLVMTVSKAAPAAGAARLAALAQQFGDLVRIDHTTQPIVEQDLVSLLDQRDPLLGGDAINDGKIVCTVGFNVVRNGHPYVLTAGHCTAGLPDWQDVGHSYVSVFPTSDYGLISDDEARPAGDIDLYDGTVQPIRTVGTARAGEQVCASGETTKVTCGKVIAVDQTVDYGNGDVVHGLIKTNVHTDHGDSGGPLYDGSAGLGTVSGGDGTTDYFQPLTTAVAAYDLKLATP